MKKRILATILLAVVLVSNGLTALAATSGLPANATIEQRKAYVQQEMERLIPRNTLYYNPSLRTQSVEPLYLGLSMNSSVTNAVNNNPQIYKDLGAVVFSDIDSDNPPWYGHLVALGVYSGMINGYPDGTFGGSNSVTIGEFATMLAKAQYDSQAIANADTDIRNQARDAAAAGSPNGGDNFMFGWVQHPTKKVWWIGPYVRVGSAMPTIMEFYYPQNEAVAASYGGTGMSRGDVARAICITFFRSEFNARVESIGGDMWGKGGGTMPSNNFTDATRINQSTTTQALVRERERLEDGGTHRFTTFELYRDCIANPSNGVPVEYLAAISILREKNIMNGYPDGSSGWDRSVTRGESLQFLYNVGAYWQANGNKW